jgi:ankyrin repeat protein
MANCAIINAVVKDDLESVRQLIEAGHNIEERYPFVNGFNDYHTPLLIAARDGHSAIVAELLKHNANVNAVEPTFGAVPLHKAVYNGHTEITEMIASSKDVNLDFQGLTNGYTPLHDALWHGYNQCADIIIDRGARLDLRGHDGKTPLEIATEVFGANDPIVLKIAKLSGNTSV